MKLLSLIILVIILSTFSCKKDEVEIRQVAITTEVEEYWLKFIEEAEKRGIDLQIDTLGFKLDFANLDSVGASTAGKCYAIPGGDILIDIDVWSMSSPQIREALIFHELGHCVLGRNHTNPEGALENNLRDYECISLMTSCLCGHACGIDYYSSLWRDYYYDELFGLTDKPGWLDVGLEYDEYIFEELIYSAVDTMESKTEITNLELEEHNYQIEINITGQEDFSVEKDNIIFNFKENNGQLGVLIDDILVFDLSYINAWTNLNDDWWNTSFTFRHINGFDYFYLKEKLIHSREGSSGVDFFRISFDEEVNHSVIISKE